MLNITSKELAVLKAIDDSEYGDYLTDGIWTWSVSDNINSNIKRSSISGIISSLVKKDLVYSDDCNEDSTIKITAKGQELYINTIGKDNVCKPIQDNS